MFVPLLALSLVQGISPSPSRLDRLQQLPATVASSATVVVLDCQVQARSLTDCRALNDAPDSGAVAEALRMAAGIVVPRALADAGAGRIKVKMNVTP
jgi:hypothetical protein